MKLTNPFPGMNPWIESPTIWPDVHTRLITAIADALSSQLSASYFVRVESQAYIIFSHQPGAQRLGRPDVSVLKENTGSYQTGRTVEVATSSGAIVEAVYLEPPADKEVLDVRFLEVRSLDKRELVTSIELLSPANKSGKGLEAYLQKQQKLIASNTNLVEIDLLRGGTTPFPQPQRSDYSILLSRSSQRPMAEWIGFQLDQALPRIPIPLRSDEPEPILNLNQIFQQIFERARYALQIDYDTPPIPAFSAEHKTWIAEMLK